MYVLCYGTMRQQSEDFVVRLSMCDEGPARANELRMLFGLQFTLESHHVRITTTSQRHPQIVSQQPSRIAPLSLLDVLWYTRIDS